MTIYPADGDPEKAKIGENEDPATLILLKNDGHIFFAFFFSCFTVFSFKTPMPRASVGSAAHVVMIDRIR